MAYYNPFQSPFMQNTQMAPVPPMCRQQQPQPQIDPQQFRQFAITLNDTALSNFAQMARAQGISEQDIQRGIQFIKSL